MANLQVWYQHAFAPKYWSVNYATAYAQAAMRLPNLDDLACDGETKPAHIVVQPGRPRKKRIRSQGEQAGGSGSAPKVNRGTKHCKLCGEAGHDRRTCQKPRTFG